MTFSLNQIFTDTYPPEAAQFCNQNGYVIKEIERQEGARRFQIQEIPSPTDEEFAEMRRQEIHAELDQIDQSSARSLRAILMAQANGKEPNEDDVQMLDSYEARAIALRQELATLN